MSLGEGTICLVSGLISDKGMVFRVWAHERMPLNLHWLVQLECAETLITKR